VTDRSVSVEFLSPEVVVRVDQRMLDFTEAMWRAIDALWQAELRERPGLFDGKILTFRGREKDTITAGVAPYRCFVARRRDPELLPLGDLEPLAVSGLVRSRGCVAFARRSSAVTQSPGMLELVPSGGIELSCVRADGTVDHREQLLRELAEETGLGRDQVVQAEPIALLHDHRDGVTDIGYIIDLADHAVPLPRPEWCGDWEYETRFWVPERDLPRFLAEHARELVPVSISLCRVFLARQQMEKA
jgi:hypothetical protein